MCRQLFKFQNFFSIGNEEQPLLLCVVYSVKLSNSLTVPNKLKQHLITNHSRLESKDQNSFKRPMTKSHNLYKSNTVIYSPLYQSKYNSYIAFSFINIFRLNKKSHYTFFLFMFNTIFRQNV